MTKAWRHPYPSPTSSTAFAGAASVIAAVTTSAAAGTSAAAAHADHVHGIFVDVPVAVGIANALGSSVRFSKADHVHAGAAIITATVHLSAAQTISAANDNTELTLLFDTVDENVGLTWDGTNHELVVVTAGFYRGEAENLWSVDYAGITNGVSTTMGYRTLHLIKNPRGTPSAAVVMSDPHVNPGGPDSTSAAAGASGRAPVSTHASREMRFAVGDRIGCSVLKVTDPTATAPVNVGSGAWMTFTRIGA